MNEAFKEYWKENAIYEFVGHGPETEEFCKGIFKAGQEAERENEPVSDGGLLDAEVIEWLDEFCLSIKIGNEKRLAVGHWTVNGSIVNAAKIAIKRIKQSKKIQFNARNQAEQLGETERK